MSPKGLGIYESIVYYRGMSGGYVVGKPVDQRHQLLMLVIDLGNAGFKLLSPCDQGHERRYRKRKPPFSALKSMARFCHGLSSASTRFS